MIHPYKADHLPKAKSLEKWLHKIEIINKPLQNFNCKTMIRQLKLKIKKKPIKLTFWVKSKQVSKIKT